MFDTPDYLVEYDFLCFIGIYIHTPFSEDIRIIGINNRMEWTRADKNWIMNVS